MNTEYQVGQVLFAIDKARFKIIPMQIVEHHVRTNLDGTQNSYFAITADRQEKIEVGSIAGPIFNTGRDAGDHLLSIASEKIDNLVSEAESQARGFEPKTMPLKEESDHQEKQRGNENTDPDSSKEMYVELPDGTRAKLSGGDVFEDFNS